MLNNRYYNDLSFTFKIIGKKKYVINYDSPQGGIFKLPKVILTGTKMCSRQNE